MTQLIQIDSASVAAHAMPNLIEIDGVGWHDRAGKVILDGLTFHVGTHDVYCLVGARDSGKTTLMRVLVNAARPSRGSACIEGISVTDRPIEARRKALFVTSSCQWYGALSCRENVALFTRLAGQDASHEVIDNALRRCGIPDRLFARRTADVDHDIRFLMWLATAVTRHVSAVILDDPVTRLSPRALTEAEEALEELRGANMAILITTADMIWAARVATTIGVLEGGKTISEHARSEWQDGRLADFCADLFTRVRGLPFSVGFDRASRLNT